MADTVHPTAGARSAPAPTRVRSVPALVVATLSAAAGLALASQHPLSGWVATALWLAVAASAWRWPAAWPAWLPAAVPVIGFMPWSGWMVVEELDLLVLAIAAGGYLARSEAAPSRRRGAPHALAPLLLVLFAVSLLVSMQRGVSDAGGWWFGWWQGYREPLNNLRLVKAFFLALLLWPLWRGLMARAPEQAERRLQAGLAAGLGTVGLLALWERIAFPGVTNFSTDYRIVALFWEMHVGGAALDAFLALTMPFALAALVSARTRAVWALLAGALALGAYATLVTFSRIDYAAVPLGLAVTGLLMRLQRSRRGTAGSLRGPVLMTAATLAFAFAAAWVFESSGYRGMLALLGAAAALLVIAPEPRGDRAGRTAALAAALSLAAVIVAVAVETKAAYAVYALVWAAVVLAALRGHATVAAGAFVGLLAASVAVAGHWGGAAAAGRMLVPALALAAIVVFVVATGHAPWPAARRWQATCVGAMATAAALVGVFAGGAYMSERLAALGSDSQARWHHWRNVVSLLDGTADWSFGRGPGRFPERAFYSGLLPMYQTGDVRLVGHGSERHVAMTGGRHMIDWGEVFRLSQRVAPPAGPLAAELDVRVEQPAELHLEVCEKHLLYNAACMVRNVKVDARPGVWQHLRVPLAGDAPVRGNWYAPHLIAFSIGVMTPGGRVEADRLQLLEANGHDLLVNGDFSRGLAHWFVTSDRNHLPWHEKSLALHLLFGQGAVGALLFTVLLAGAAWRVVAGSARDLVIAPPLAGALAGFVFVGLIDSLLDAPRIAFVFYLLLLVALTSPPLPRAQARPTA